jgi:hypothetical protein
MKNTKLFIYTLLACLVLWVGFNISAARLKFGGATLNDSTASLITTNKGLRVNGVISSSDTLRTSGILRSTELQLTGSSPQILWTTYGMNIDGGIDVLNYNANAHTIATESGTSLIYADSTNGVLTYLQGFSNNGRGLLKRAIYQSTLGSTTPGNFINIAHGISPITKIVSWSVKMYDDSTSTWYPTAYVGTTSLTTGTATTIGPTNLSHLIPAASGNWKNAGDTIRWEVLYLGN